MNDLTLYQISNDYREAVEKLSDMDLPPEAVNDTLEGLKGDLTTKATNVAMFTLNLDSLAEQIRQAELTMAHRRKVLENRAEAVRNYIKTCMESAGISKIECPLFKMSIKKNPPSVEIYDESQIPQDLMRSPPPPPKVPDKKLIAERLSKGEVVGGTRLMNKTRLEIK